MPNQDNDNNLKSFKDFSREDVFHIQEIIQHITSEIKKCKLEKHLIVYEKIARELSKMFNTIKSYENPDIDVGELIFSDGKVERHDGLKEFEGSVVGFGMLSQIIVQMIKNVGLQITDPTSRNIIMHYNYELYRKMNDCRSSIFQEFIEYQENIQKPRSRLVVNEETCNGILVNTNEIEKGMKKARFHYVDNKKTVNGEVENVKKCISLFAEILKLHCADSTRYAEHVIREAEKNIKEAEKNIKEAEKNIDTPKTNVAGKVALKIKKLQENSRKLKKNINRSGIKIQMLESIIKELKKKLLLRYSLDAKGKEDRKLLWSNSFNLLETMHKILKKLKDINSFDKSKEIEIAQRIDELEKLGKSGEIGFSIRELIDNDELSSADIVRLDLEVMDLVRKIENNEELSDVEQIKIEEIIDSKKEIRSYIEGNKNLFLDKWAEKLVEAEVFDKVTELYEKFTDTKKIEIKAKEIFDNMEKIKRKKISFIGRTVFNKINELETVYIEYNKKIQHEKEKEINIIAGCNDNINMFISKFNSRASAQKKQPSKIMFNGLSIDIEDPDKKLSERAAKKTEGRTTPIAGGTINQFRLAPKIPPTLFVLNNSKPLVIFSLFVTLFSFFYYATTSGKTQKNTLNTSTKTGGSTPVPTGSKKEIVQINHNKPTTINKKNINYTIWKKEQEKQKEEHGHGHDHGQDQENKSCIVTI